MVKANPEDIRAAVAAVIDQRSPSHIVGVDEVGYGACAGPLVIGAVRVPRDWKPPEGLTDSKLLSGPQIAALAAAFREAANAFTWDVLWFDAGQIDRMGLGRVRAWGFELAVSKLLVHGALAFVDGNLRIDGAMSFPKADLVIPACSMASVLAKDAHDRYMCEQDKLFPGYGFASHVGYDVKAHRRALERLGPCELHRQSNQTVRRIVEERLGHFEEVESAE